ncbi:HSP20-like chaperone [Delitschia confertaspora ATCC 74209]|uniref:HSP20-like chaperone n=1 Tax=Delitschia confertaspora ATCC 74209 TaxID=1513339 RepID=A0A9P4MQQ4_9PLEO|nr:HSP20-like chaperone [Delitschia confertaspora ATCC 74209]
MAAFLFSPVAFAPAYCSPSQCNRPFAPAPRVSVNPFLSLIDDTINQLQREVKRQTRYQRSFNARFDVRENNERYQVYGEVPGFEQENIDIEVSDEHTLKISGSTDRKTQTEPQCPPQPQSEIQLETEKMEVEPSTMEVPRISQNSEEHHSETSSVRSHQPTVEDDFEDLGAGSDAAATPASSTPSTPLFNGKEKATEMYKASETAIVQQPEQQVPVQKHQQSNERIWVSERSFGSFTRTFRFPDCIDSARVSASLKNGLLTITVPKAERPQIRRITIL